ncbi:hypothetical protein SAMN02745217_03341 [Anaerocolumna xylanovorans DSM 12503]|uniref:Uncharacterized protein n=1 Tax=Anaerocolumna xylanovorans DSM 12503 TaxID=1121345 RepID=A0A1M7YGR9_9FIRM|nr:hypothetical protein SAMN02745217_03341 [Anaerocolumna xylanovorans DSM 12503]
MKKNRPVLVQYIADLNFLNAFLLIVSLFPNFTKRFGVITPEPTLFNVSYRIFATLILITISYGLLRLKKWGYWLMIAYNMFFLSMSVILLFKLTKQSIYSPGFIISILGLSLTLSAKRYFMKENM